MLKRSTLITSIAFIALSLTSSLASAQDAPKTTEAPTTRTFSVTFSPFHIVSRMFEAGLEYAITPHDGVMVYGGYGVPQAELSDGTTLDITTWEVGAQYRRYLLGDFDGGLQVGAEFQFVDSSASTDAFGFDINANVRALSPGLFLGGKHTFGFGLTSELQVGGAYNIFMTKGDASDGTNDVELEEEREGEFDLLINLNLGWSF